MDVCKSPTLEAFGNKNILITGTTGFVGKVVLEKLLRSVPNIGKIHLLIRGNSLNPTAKKRFLSEVATSSIFDSLKRDDPDSFDELCNDKLHFVTGELTEPNFGMNEAAFTELAGKIDVVINSAASVNFREPLNDALLTNTESLYTLAKLASVKRIPVVHVSTCYVNGFHTGLIEEKVGGPAGAKVERDPAGFYRVEPLMATLMQKIAETKSRYRNDNEREQALIQLGLREAHRYGWNDTYTFTKWMGEQLLMQQLQGQSLTIVRPSIVESTWQGPVPGWIEGVKVADAIILAYAREKVTFFPGNRHAVVDIIPADLVANSLILAAAEALRQPAAHRIYQCSSSFCNPVVIKDFIRHVQEEAQQNHARYRNLFYRKPQRPFVMVPGVVFNSVVSIMMTAMKMRTSVMSRLGGKPPGVRQENLEATMKLAMVFSFYTRPRYRFSNDQLYALAERMGEMDRALFPVDARCVDWALYLRKIHLSGLNDFALQRKAAKTRQAVARTEPAVV